MRLLSINAAFRNSPHSFAGVLPGHGRWSQAISEHLLVILDVIGCQLKELFANFYLAYTVGFEVAPLLDTIFLVKERADLLFVRFDLFRVQRIVRVHLSVIIYQYLYNNKNF